MGLQKIRNRWEICKNIFTNLAIQRSELQNISSTFHKGSMLTIHSIKKEVNNFKIKDNEDDFTLRNLKRSRTA